MTTAPTQTAAEPQLSAGTVTAVAVVYQLLEKDWEEPPSTAIDKRAVPGRVAVRGLGLARDTQCDSKHHGGVYQAVYAYADEDAAWWAAELGREIPPGRFGENLRTVGIDVTGAEIGERWRIGSPDDGLLLEVTAPRIPCRTFQDHMAEPHWVKRFTERNAPGAYLRVLEPGTVGAGDTVAIQRRPGHGVSVGDVTRTASPQKLQRLLDAAHDLGLDLEPSLKERAVQKAERG
jgi:MOSC domain-containing protein YiiM